MDSYAPRKLTSDVMFRGGCDAQIRYTLAMPSELTRREFATLLSAAAAAACVRGGASAQSAMPVRALPRGGESLPIIGLGSTKPVTSIAELGAERVAALVRTLVERGGRVIDTWPRNAANDGAFGRIIAQPDWRDRLFVTMNIEHDDVRAATERFESTLERYGRDAIDLANIGSLRGLDALWPTFQSWQREGRARYIGVTAAQAALYDRLEEFLGRATPDFVEINYSVTERDAERRLLPLLADRGIAVLVSRPFMNGAYFERLAHRPLPEWSAEFECASWAQFSLQYILANPAVTCVLTETTDPVHMAENADTALRPVPDAAARERMRALIDAA
jgi:diketogulonate reductase-like aldo/keto reductase